MAALASINLRTVMRLPFSAAIKRAVAPSCSAAFRSALHSIRVDRIELSARSEAMMTAVAPLGPLWLTSAPRETSSRTIWHVPSSLVASHCLTATVTGVCPASLAAFMSTPLHSDSVRTTGRKPPTAASSRAVSPPFIRALTLAPSFASMSSTSDASSRAAMIRVVRKSSSVFSKLALCLASTSTTSHLFLMRVRAATTIGVFPLLSCASV
mmetsp:Transcript_48706/g.95500  ORF Transcript_48706/g.95500 Transcript_48706/m.95500 type:complete len:211 (+) Transcript_48706:383-1015(+)